MDQTVEQNLIEEFGVMNFQKIEEIQDKIKNDCKLSKNESQYIIYTFNRMHGNFVEMLTYCAEEQAKVRVIYEYMKRMGLDFDHDVLKESCLGESLGNFYSDIIEEFNKFEIDDDYYYDDED